MCGALNDGAPRVHTRAHNKSQVAPTDLDPYFPKLAAALRSLLELNFSEASAPEHAAQIRRRAEAMLPVGTPPLLPPAVRLTTEEQCTEFAQLVAQQV
jgi:hypothetical protein